MRVRAIILRLKFRFQPGQTAKHFSPPPVVSPQAVKIGPPPACRAMGFSHVGVLIFTGCGRLGISENLADVYIFRFDRDSLIFCTRLLPAVRAGLLARFLLMGLGWWGALAREEFLCHV